jgi:hypothetical protein
VETAGAARNEQLTAITGVTLIVLLAAIGITIVQIGQLIWLHLFIGLVLLGPVALKLASTGYRFARYYAGDRAYRKKGPPPVLMRVIAAAVVVSTLVVFVSGVLLLATGPGGRDQYLFLHKASFFVWLAFAALHVLGHLPGLGGTLRAAVPTVGRSGIPTRDAGRWIALVGAVAGGLVLAVVLIPDFGSWTAHGIFVHHGRR